MSKQSELVEASQNISFASDGEVGITVGANERLNIDASGRVTTPYQPAARASWSGTSDLGATNKIPLNYNSLSRGGMSVDTTNNRISVPVGGYYFIGYHHLAAGTGTQISIRINGVALDGAYTQMNLTGNDNFSVQVIESLSANDYIEFWVTGGAIHKNASYNMMYAHLLG